MSAIKKANYFIRCLEESSSPSKLTEAELRNKQEELLQLSNSNVAPKKLMLCIEKYMDFVINVVSLHKEYKRQHACQQYFQTIKDIVLRDKSLTGLFMSELTETIFSIVIKEDTKNWIIKKAILRVYNDCQTAVDKSLKNRVARSLNEMYFFKLVDCISTYPDYDFQVMLIETIFRLYGKTAVNKRLKDIIPESTELSQSFAGIRTVTFEEDVRLFLNNMNTLSKRVFSIICNTIRMEQYVCKDPMDTVTGIWLDYNLTDEILTWYCLKESFFGTTQYESGICTLITVQASDVTSFETLTFPDENKLIMCLDLGSPCISLDQDVQLIINSIKHINFVFEDCSNSHYLLDVLQNITRKYIDKTKKPVKIKIPHPLGKVHEASLLDISMTSKSEETNSNISVFRGQPTTVARKENIEVVSVRSQVDKDNVCVSSSDDNFQTAKDDSNTEFYNTAVNKVANEMEVLSSNRTDNHKNEDIIVQIIWKKGPGGNSEAITNPISDLSSSVSTTLVSSQESVTVTVGRTDSTKEGERFNCGSRTKLREEIPKRKDRHQETDHDKSENIPLNNVDFICVTNEDGILVESMAVKNNKDKSEVELDKPSNDNKSEKLLKVSKAEYIDIQKNPEPVTTNEQMLKPKKNRQQKMGKVDNQGIGRIEEVVKTQVVTRTAQNKSKTKQNKKYTEDVAAPTVQAKPKMVYPSKKIHYKHDNLDEIIVIEEEHKTKNKTPLKKSKEKVMSDFSDDDDCFIVNDNLSEKTPSKKMKKQRKPLSGISKAKNKNAPENSFLRNFTNSNVSFHSKSKKSRRVIPFQDVLNSLQEKLGGREGIEKRNEHFGREKSLFPLDLTLPKNKCTSSKVEMAEKNVKTYENKKRGIHVVNEDEIYDELSPSERRIYNDQLYALRVPGPVPSWQGKAVVEEQIVTMKMEDFLGKYLVMFFYPLIYGFPPEESPKEIIELNDIIEDFIALNCEVVTVTLDAPYTHLDWLKSIKEKSGKDIRVILLSDLNHSISNSLSIHMKHWGHMLRRLIVIDPKGIIRFRLDSDGQFPINVSYLLECVKHLWNNQNLP